MKKRILIIDDEADILMTTKLALESHGYEVDTAETGENWISKFDKQAVDLLLLDLRLPNKNGFQVAREIKSHELYKKTPIIAFSAMSDATSRQIAARSDVLEFIDKPIDLDKLLFYIKDIVGS
ncbi:MAG: response regulator [Candidatus Omnitrophota bacterium]